MEGLEVDGIIS